MKILYVIALIIAGGLSLSAQERQITEAEFTDITRKAESDLYKGVYGPIRMVVETAVRNQGRPELDYNLNSVSLTVPGQGTHRIEQRSIGGKPTRTETISLSDSAYILGTDGVWKKVRSGPQSYPEPAAKTDADKKVLERQAEFKYAGTETYGKHTVDVYTKFEREKTSNSATGSTFESEKLIKIRITSDGKYHRFESNTKTINAQGRPGNVNIIIEIEADPSIKLAVPTEPK